MNPRKIPPIESMHPFFVSRKPFAIGFALPKTFDLVTVLLTTRLVGLIVISFSTLEGWEKFVSGK